MVGNRSLPPLLWASTVKHQKKQPRGGFQSKTVKTRQEQINISFLGRAAQLNRRHWKRAYLTRADKLVFLFPSCKSKWMFKAYCCSLLRLSSLLIRSACGVILRIDSRATIEADCRKLLQEKAAVEVALISSSLLLVFTILSCRSSMDRSAVSTLASRLSHQNYRTHLFSLVLGTFSKKHHLCA